MAPHSGSESCDGGREATPTVSLAQVLTPPTLPAASGARAPYSEEQMRPPMWEEEC